MEYSKLVAVTGLPGLCELISRKNDGAIVRSLDDNSTRFASARINNFSHLESIEVYTSGENVNLVEIFKAMDKAGGTLPDGKDNAALKKYFETAYPELDFERVYSSDLKKMVKWFDILKKKNVEIKLSELPAEEEVVAEEVEEVKAVEEAPKKKTAAKKEDKAETPKKKAADADEPVKEKAPAKKKAAAKKEDKEEKEEAPKKKAAAKKK